MRGTAKDHFGVFREESLGANRDDDKPNVIETSVENETDEGKATIKELTEEEAPQSKGQRAPDLEEESKDAMEEDTDTVEEEKKDKTTNVDAEADEEEWSKTKPGLPRSTLVPPVLQQPPLRPRPRNEQEATQLAQQAEIAARLSSQAAALNQLPVTANVGLGWAALAAVPPSIAATNQVPETPRATMQLGTQTLLYTVGFGIDPRQAIHNQNDATEAAVRALRDAMERSTVRLPPSATGSVQHSPFQIHVKLGVPPRKGIQPTMEPMSVDMTRVAAVLPRSIPILPVDVVVGGLAISGKDDPDVSICCAAACVTVQTNANAQRHAWERAAVAAQQQLQVQTSVDTSPWSDVDRRRDGTGRSVVSRVDSMEMLARISEQVRERPFAAGTLGDMLRPDEHSAYANETDLGAAAAAKQSNQGDKRSEGADNYKKLPPGKTAKNNKRKFVQHHYTDYSGEKAPRMDETPLYSARGKSVGTAFPVKLHELLSEIEADGYAYIMSWLPHGRSFKIHKQQEFLDVILPNYFVMTKKSSFLRQLNLYSFNRISAGPDKGSYYHELFLRGMPFLCKRMVRMKVNGNGIRAAGNPEAEPNFYELPPVPADHELAIVRDGERARVESPPAPPPAAMRSKQVVEHELVLPPRPVSPKTTSKIGSSQVSFPLKLHTMLDTLESEGNTDVVSWRSHGRAFIVHKPDEFVNGLMPTCFRQSKYSSFQRQLHMYSFQRITSGMDKGAYYHENFLRGKPHLAMKMVRTRVNGKGCRKPGDPSSEPDFYAMQSMESIQPGTVVEIPMDLAGKDSSTDEEDDKEVEEL